MKNLSLLFTLLLLLASCSKENQADIDSNEGVHASFTFTTAPMQGDGSTRSNSSVDESKITRLWVLQFVSNADSSGVLLKRYYTDDISTTATMDVLLKANDSGVKSNIYFVANVPNETLANFTGNETAFRTTVQNVVSESGFIMCGDGSDKVTIPSIPMSGKLANQTVTSIGISGGINVTLTRMLACVQLSYKMGTLAYSKIDLKTIRVCNVPKVMNYIAPATDTYPVNPSATTVQDFSYENAINSTEATTTLTFYLPENIRGNGTNTTGSDKYKTGIPFATYIELIGKGKSSGSLAGENVYFRLYPGSDTQNNYDIKRNTRYSLTANLQNTSFSDRRLLRSGNNCYIVAPNGGTVNIPICRANLSLLGNQIQDIYNPNCIASIYWQTTSGMVTVSNADCSNGFFTVTTSGSNTGNAVVCIKDKTNGNILWSWHIWVSAIDFKSLTNTTNFNYYIWMDRDLGATAVPDGTNTFGTTAGMLYQWGRKDPFLPAITTTGTTPTIYNYNEMTNSYTYVTSKYLLTLNAIANDSYTNYSSSSDYGNLLKYSIQAPMLFFPNWAGSTADAVAGSSVGVHSWGGAAGDSKSVYDPCPAGWRVPSFYNSANPSSPLDPWSSLPSVPVINQNTEKAYCSFALNSNVNYYPDAGFRGATNGSLMVMGISGWYWSSTIGSGKTNPYSLGFTNNATYLGRTDGSDGSRPNGYSVRCVKDV